MTVQVAKKHLSVLALNLFIDEAGHHRTYKMILAPNEDTDQLAHPLGLVRAFGGRSTDSYGL